MIIEAVECHAVSVPRVYRTKVASTGGLGDGKIESHYILIELADSEGNRGLGEIPDIELTWGTVDASDLEGGLSEALSGEARPHEKMVSRSLDVLDREAHKELRTALTFAVDTALWDLKGKHLRKPLYELLGGRSRPALPVTWVAYIRGVGELENEISEKREEGFQAYKLKVGDNFELDCERIRIARRIAGREAHLRIDASGAWNINEAIDHLRQMAELGADAVETPLMCASRTIAKENPERVNENVEDVAESLARLRRETPVKMIEHVGDFDDAFAEALIKCRAVDAFNVIPCQAGGLSRSMRLLSLAASAGIDGLLGSSVELSPGTAAAAHLGVASRGVTMASDLVGPGLLAGDVVDEPLPYREGMIFPSDRSGIGVALDPVKIAAYRNQS